MQNNEDIEYQPNVRKDSGLYCFVDSNRPCDSSCMAYVVSPKAKASNSDLEDQNLNCAIVANIERAGRALTIVSQIGHALLKLKKTGAADAERIRKNASSRNPVSSFAPNTAEVKNPFGGA